MWLNKKTHRLCIGLEMPICRVCCRAGFGFGALFGSTRGCLSQHCALTEAQALPKLVLQSWGVKSPVVQQPPPMGCM